MNIKKLVRGCLPACAVMLALASVSCGDMAREGQASSYLIITSLQAASGAEPDELGGVLNSDVTPIFNDVGEVEFLLAMKDPTVTGPTSANFITIDRYRVSYFRTDGHNIEGVDVPYAFDSAFTGTVSASAAFGFTIVRHQAKGEAPLRALGQNFLIVSTIAEVTFYGRDQTGRAVSVTGRININFANFADPE